MFDIKINPSYTLSETENKIMNETLAKATLEFATARRNLQKQMIISYIDNNINAGKKMQHVIADESEHAKLAYKK